MEAIESPHEILLTHGRRVVLGRVRNGSGEAWGVAFYRPKAPASTLRKLAERANCGHLESAERLRSMPQERTAAVMSDLRYAVETAVSQQDAARAEQIARQVVDYAESFGWV